MRKVLSIIFVALWMGFIFFNSSQSGDESNIKSYAITNQIKNSMEDVNGDTTISDNNEWNSHTISENMKKVNLFIRKSAHAFEYFILAILILYALSRFDTKTRENVILALFLVLLYAVGDEYHQLFVAGRSSNVTDVIIDFIGGILGVATFYISKYCIIKLRGKLSHYQVQS